ncbi:nuclear transport factor 2 family protein [Mucilaginibacter robiniae]|nr:nuclear transport factor 2 family protein [Mucilaginibacter robiniae]
MSISAMAQSKEETEVAQAVTALTKAMTDADTTQLSKLTSAHLSYGHSSGKVQTQAEFIHSLATGESDFVSINLTEQTITVSGTTALVRHTLAATTNDSGKPGTVKLYILLVWQKTKSHWILLGRQAIKPPVS